MSDSLWLGALVLAVVLNSVLRLRLIRHMHDLERRTDLVVAALTVWAEHWGESPDEVRPHLLKVLRR